MVLMFLRVVAMGVGHVCSTGLPNNEILNQVGDCHHTGSQKTLDVIIFIQLLTTPSATESE